MTHVVSEKKTWKMKSHRASITLFVPRKYSCTLVRRVDNRHSSTHCFLRTLRFLHTGRYKMARQATGHCIHVGSIVVNGRGPILGAPVVDGVQQGVLPQPSAPEARRVRDESSRKRAIDLAMTASDPIDGLPPHLRSDPVPLVKMRLSSSSRLTEMTRQRQYHEDK
jgi:hypothetical protein